MLILAGITVTLTVNNGLLEKAKEATGRYDMESIKEQAETIESETMIQLANDNNGYLWERIIIAINEKFENSTKNGNLITTSDEKYDIRVNSDYSIEVAKHGEIEDTYIPEGIVTGCKAWVNNKPQNVELWASGYIDGTKLKEYAVNFTSEEKMFERIKEMTGEPYDKCNTYLEFVLYNINNNWLKNATYSTLEACLQDDTVKKAGITTVEQLIYYYYNSIFSQGDEVEGNSMSLTECLKNEYSYYIFNSDIKEDGIYNIKVEITTPDKEKEVTGATAYYFSKNTYFFQVDGGVPISKNGKYYINVIIDGITYAKYEYEVTYFK